MRGAGSPSWGLLRRGRTARDLGSAGRSRPRRRCELASGAAGEHSAMPAEGRSPPCGVSPSSPRQLLSRHDVDARSPQPRPLVTRASPWSRPATGPGQGKSPQTSGRGVTSDDGPVRAVVQRVRGWPACTVDGDVDRLGATTTRPPADSWCSCGHHPTDIRTESSPSGWPAKVLGTVQLPALVHGERSARETDARVPGGQPVHVVRAITRQGEAAGAATQLERGRPRPGRRAARRARRRDPAGGRHRGGHRPVRCRTWRWPSSTTARSP